jgi:hypothetical protein
MEAMLLELEAWTEFESAETESEPTDREREREARRRLIQETLAQALPPTFAVALPGFAMRPTVLSRGLLPFPHLWLEAKDFENAVREILATCAATRN